MSNSLRSWLQTRVIHDADAYARDTLGARPGGRVQIVQFLTYDGVIRATVCDKTHYITAQFAEPLVNSFRGAPLRFTQLRGAYFALRSCCVAAVERGVVLDVFAADVLGGIHDPVHSDSLRSVLAMERPPAALVAWVRDATHRA